MAAGGVVIKAAAACQCMHFPPLHSVTGRLGSGLCYNIRKSPRPDIPLLFTTSVHKMQPFPWRCQLSLSFLFPLPPTPHPFPFNISVCRPRLHLLFIARLLPEWNFSTD